ncbi:hypothetical protein [Pedobacter agri]|uniref:hypothetical protein n=1 Tax=Pedobacter agri TaxID=454586 RepID=UPI00292FD2B5|nr:hypothetical protein [Pedobacter agri]
MVRNSDNKLFDSLTIINNSRRAQIERSNFYSFSFKDGDKVLLNNKLLDFTVNRDTLFFFDKTREIEEVQLVSKNLTERREHAVKSKKTNAYADIASNNRVGTLIKFNSKKRTFIKSIILFPKEINSPTGKLEIQLLDNVNGMPDNGSPLISFEKNFPDTVQKEWEIVLPRPVKYSENGLFAVFYHHADNKKWTITLRLNADSQMYMFYPQTNEWKKMSFNGYQYKLKVLQ